MIVTSDAVVGFKCDFSGGATSRSQIVNEQVIKNSHSSNRGINNADIQQDRPVLIRPEEWLKNSIPPLGSQEGHHFGGDCVVIRYSTDVIGEGPNLHVHPYDESFHILDGRAQFTVGGQQFDATAGALVIGPANVPHSYKNLGPGRLDSVDFHLSPEWIQYDLPRDGESLTSGEPPS